MYASTSVDARTGEILSFYNDNPYLEGEFGFDKDAARAEAEKFLQGFKPEKFAETLLEEEEEEFVIYRTEEEKLQRYYYFTYTRQVNGIPFPDNGLHVTFDSVQGRVVRFSMDWFDVEFPGLENVISSEDAHAALYENIGLELQYKQVSEISDVIPLPEILPLPVDLVDVEVDVEIDTGSPGDGNGAGDTGNNEDSNTDSAGDGTEDSTGGGTTNGAADGTTSGAADGTGGENGAEKEESVTVTTGESENAIAVPPELEYKSIDRVIGSVETVKMPVFKAVYALKSGKPLILDAYTGNVLDYNGKPYKEDKVPEYNDIAGHFAEEQIKTLAKFGIINFSGPEYRPNEKITQKDFLMVVSNILDNYYGPVIKEDSEQDDIDEMYKQLIREGVIDEEEKAPESLITRENAVKYIIRALKYREIAEIEGIFIVAFSDEEDITPALKGYVAIASGLKIVQGSGGKFYPKNNLTRGETAVMIYNYLDKK